MTSPTLRHSGAPLSVAYILLRPSLPLALLWPAHSSADPVAFLLVDPDISWYRLVNMFPTFFAAKQTSI